MNDSQKRSAGADSQYRKMTETPVAKLVLALGFPTTVSMLITNVYNMADSYFVSQISLSAGGATSIVFGIMAILQAFGFMFGHGAGSNISRMLGSKQVEKASRYASTGFFGAALCGLCILTAGLIFLEPLMFLLGSTETILIGDIIERQFKQGDNANMGAALSLLLMLLVFVCTGIMNRFGSDEEGGVLV